jgi:hypothetical protein
MGVRAAPLFGTELLEQWVCSHAPTHTMRHSYRSWLDAVGTTIAVQQKLMRHSDVRTTMNTYGDVVTDEMAQANSKVAAFDTQRQDPSTLIAFTARVLLSSDNRNATGKVGVDFLVEPSTVSVADLGNGKSMNIGFYAVVFSPEGKMLSNRSMKVD